MKGLVSKNNVLTLVNDIQTPVPKAGEVLVQIDTASVNPADPDIAAGLWDEFFEMKSGYKARTGFEFAGIVLTEGTKFKKGDKVFGYIDVFNNPDWAHQELITIDEDCICFMPENISFEEAAITPMAAQTSLEALERVGQLQKDEKVLIIGAAGGLGIFAVQIAKVLGAYVTAIGGPRQDNYLKDLGADIVYNYKDVKLSDIDDKFDIILDLSTAYKFKDIENHLSAAGRFIPADPVKNEEDLKEGTNSSKKTRYLLAPKGMYHELSKIKKWIDEGQVRPVVAEIYDIEDFESAMTSLKTKEKFGRIGIKILKKE